MGEAEDPGKQGATEEGLHGEPLSARSRISITTGGRLVPSELSMHPAECTIRGYEGLESDMGLEEGFSSLQRSLTPPPPPVGGGRMGSAGR